MFRGGTEVTLIGTNFDSVADPRITITVVNWGANDCLTCLTYNHTEEVSTRSHLACTISRYPFVRLLLLLGVADILSYNELSFLMDPVLRSVLALQIGPG